MPITAIAELALADMACSSGLAPLASFSCYPSDGHGSTRHDSEHFRFAPRTCGPHCGRLEVRKTKRTGQPAALIRIREEVPLPDMKRRNFITLLDGAAAAWPLAARAQQAATPVIGFMSARSPEDSVHLLEAFRRDLEERGFVEGRNVVIEYRWARGDYDRLPDMAADLVSRRVNVLTAVGGDPSPRAAKRATASIPIVFGMGDDPVKDGLVESFNRPGGNVTGMTLMTTLMEPKRFGLLRDLVPDARLVRRSSQPELRTVRAPAAADRGGGRPHRAAARRRPSQ